VPLTDRIDFALTRIGRPAEIGEVRAVVAALYGTPISRQTMSTVLNDMARAGFVTRENAGPGHPTLWASPRPVNP
jgi:DNA-binding HxlR family transcriptional regulator